MGPILLALFACAAYGISDYLQGIAARKASSMPVMIVAQTSGLLAVAIATPALGGSPSGADLIWGVCLGILLLCGIALLIYSFTHGPITVASTVIAVIGIAFPVLYGLATGEHLDESASAGLCLGIVAILLINLGKSSSGRLSTLAFVAAIASGVMFGGFGIVLSKTGHQAGLWPLLVAYLVRSILLGALVVALRPARLMQSCRIVLPAAGVAGVMVTLASAALLLSLQLGGQLVIVNTISFEAPIVTVALAIILLKERPTVVQTIGLLAGFASLVFMAL